MKGILTVLGFTFREQARKKSFIITTIILFVIVLAAICAPAVINSFKGSSSGTQKAGDSGTVYVIDSGNILAGNTAALQESFKSYKFVGKTEQDKSSLVKTIKDDSKSFLVELQFKDNSPSFNYYFKNAGDGPDPDSLSRVIKNIYNAEIIKGAGLPDTLAAKLAAPVTCKENPLGSFSMSSMIAGYAVILLLFMAIYTYGVWVAMSIASEKTTRVMEILITSTKPSKIVIGKSAAMGLLGLCQMLALIAVSGIAYYFLYPKDFKVGGEALNLGSFSPVIVIMMIIYFVFGFSLYAMMNAVAGATVSRSEEVNQAITPVAIISVICFYFSYSVVMLPESPAAVVASIIPFTSAFSMPTRMLSTQVPVWQIALSLVLLAGTTALMCLISIKLYSAAVLHYGRRLNIKELVKMANAK